MIHKTSLDPCQNPRLGRFDWLYYNDIRRYKTALFVPAVSRGSSSREDSTNLMISVSFSIPFFPGDDSCRHSLHQPVWEIRVLLAEILPDQSFSSSKSCESAARIVCAQIRYPSSLRCTRSSRNSAGRIAPSDPSSAPAQSTYRM
ncbi:hypothetical protein SDC9_71677 [bioreactor metagenome]|uniref:Uncharacterized protein n=1 Tax=bioreactor metagenome TaxID=1076179 RepID=A0A644YAH1_9ZZZZ